MRALLLPALLLAAGLAAAAPSDADKPKKPKVKLAVLVVFDQMRGDYLDKWAAHLGDGGFKRLMTAGAHFPDCHYPFATTATGPGHASILAGCGPDKHGIVNNNWYDRAAGEDAYCAGTTRYELVPPPAGTDPDNLDPRRRKKPVGAGTPDRLLGPTLADVLKATTGGAGKVVGVSLKDRAAVLPAGKSKPDGVYWFEGAFGTSTYYRDALPAWVTAFNKSGTAESYFKKDWVRLRDDLDYAALAGPDDGPGEGAGKGQGKTFPHPTTGGKDKIGKDYYEAMVNSPYGNDLLLAFAKAAVKGEKLGQDDVPDLLTISFSSNDLVGHAWGPDSQEVFDITLRSDAAMADLLTYLDTEVGPGNYTLVVTADHGVCPLPEASRAAGNAAAKRLSPVTLLTGAERLLQDAYGKPAAAEKPADGKKEKTLHIEAAVPPNLYLNHKLLKAKGVDPADAAAKLAGWLKTQPGVVRAYTQADLVKTADPADEFHGPSKKSFRPDRSGDVVVVTAPYCLLDSYGAGTNHGTPHKYDTHSVFLAFGPGVPGGRQAEAVTPLHAAPILADALGVNRPANAEYGLPAALAGAAKP